MKTKIIEEIKVPLTVRQAQKILSKRGSNNFYIREPEFGSRTTFYQFVALKLQALEVSDLNIENIYANRNTKVETCVIDGDLLKRSLDKIASKDPHQPLFSWDKYCEDYEDYEGAEEDFDFGEEADTLEPDSLFQSVEDGRNSGEDKSSISLKTQSQDSSEADFRNAGEASGSGETPQNATASGDIRADDRSETDDFTSEDLEAAASSPVPTFEKAKAPSRIGEGIEGSSAALPSVSEPRIETDTNPEKPTSRNDEVEVNDQEPSEGKCQVAGDNNVKSEGQASLETNIDCQGQSGDISGEDNQDENSVDAEENLDWDDTPNLDLKQLPDVPQHQKKWGKSFSKQERRDGQLSASAKKGSGGINSSLAKAGISPKLQKECRRKLAKLVGDASNQPSPRRDYQKFCERLKSYRNPSPARKEESGRPVILIMADVSGSCAGFSDESVMVAKAASKLGVAGSDILVLTHSNGYPSELEHNGKTVDAETYDELADFYNRLISRFNITVGIALGDWDAVEQYLLVMVHPQCKKFIWLDSAHCSSRKSVKDETRWALKERLPRYASRKSLKAVRHKLTYKMGCKDAKTFVKELS